VDSIDDLDSVDLVGLPSHRGGIWEGAKVRTTVRRLREHLQRRGHTRLARVLREAAEAGVLSDRGGEVEVPDMTMQDDVTDDQGEDGVVAALQQTWDEIFRSGSLDANAKLQRCQMVLKSLADAVGDGGLEEDDADESDQRYRSMDEGESCMPVTGRAKESRLARRPSLQEMRRGTGVGAAAEAKEKRRLEMLSAMRRRRGPFG
jgi:hypothetical protein